MALSLAPHLTQRTYRWQAFVAAHHSKALVLQFDEEESSYTIWGYDGPEVYVCTIWTGAVPPHIIASGYTQEQNDADKADFETNYKSGCNAKIDQRSDEGVSKVMLVPGQVDRKMVITGIRFDAGPNSTTDNDKSFGETREIQGGQAEVANFVAGDYVELTIHAPDGTKLGQYGETLFIPPSGKIDQIVSEGTVSIPAGFKLRTTYVSVNSGNIRTVYCWYRLRK